MGALRAHSGGRHFFDKKFSDVEIRTVNFYIEEVFSDVTIFVYALTDLTKEALSSSFQIEAF